MIAPRPRHPQIIIAAAVALSTLPFLGQALHIDDANFLILAEGARADAWRPHDVVINWLGTEERAFDVLSNPPGVAYVLAAVRALGGGEVACHLAILPFTALAAWGMWRLAARFTAHPLLPTLMFCLSPAVVVSAHLIMPDLPLVGCWLAGLALAIEGVDRGDRRRALGGALLLGCASLFRYSGLTGGPLLALYLLLQRRRSPLSGGALVGIGAAWALIPSLWTLHDLHAYGQSHFWHMIAFQRDAAEADAPGLHLLTQLVFLGGTAAAPLAPLIPVGWAERRPGARLPAALILGGMAVAVAALVLAPPGDDGLEILLAAAFGSTAALLWGAALWAQRGAGSWRAAWAGRGGARADALLLLAWAAGMVIFNQQLRFVAARYLLLGIPPLLLLGARALGAEGPPRWAARLAVAGGALIALGLSAAEHNAAEVYRDFAQRRLQETIPAGAEVYVLGHWGLQHYLAQAGARPLNEAGPPPPPGSWIVAGGRPWPQELPPGTGPLTLKARWSYRDRLPLKTLLLHPPACFHADALALGHPLHEARAGEASGPPVADDVGWGMSVTSGDPSGEPWDPGPPRAQRTLLPWAPAAGMQADETLVIARVGEAP